MINFIVGSALVMAAVFFVTWLFLPALRQRIEQPKFIFQERLTRVERATVSDTQVSSRKGGSNE